MSPDLEKYRPYVAGFDLTPEQQDQLIHSLWVIMESFADHAFGIHPAQLALPIVADEDCSGADRALDFYEGEITEDFNHHAEAGDERTSERD